jgi:hypothetical protein
MLKQPAYHQAYVLWLIREGKARSVGDLWTHFEEGGPTVLGMMFESLESLEKAQLIQANPQLASLRALNLAPEEVKKVILSTTQLLTFVQNALRLSLTELAQSDLFQRLLVTPILKRGFSKKYQSDILVFMPFKPELDPVYDDHLRAVAQEIGKTIARADDFFTSGVIMDEIWTAILESKIILADCTGRNPNVFYEIGLCHAIGKQTILITQSRNDIPFDLQHRRYIEYQLTPRGMQQFEGTLKKTIESVLSEEM